MNGRIHINFTPGEGAILRMLGLVERRGFAVRSIAMAEKTSAASIAMDVEARDPFRRLDVLARQLERLIDVRTVSFSLDLSGPSA